MRFHIGHMGACLLVVLALAGCQNTNFGNNNYSPNKRKPNVQQLPLYPGAQNMKVQDISASVGAQAQLISFQTNDLPELVLQFYKDALLNDGWEDPLNPTPNSFFVGWSNSVDEPRYRLTVTTEIQRDGKTNVQLKLVTDYSE